MRVNVYVNERVLRLQLVKFSLNLFFFMYSFSFCQHSVFVQSYGSPCFHKDCFLFLFVSSKLNNEGEWHDQYYGTRTREKSEHEHKLDSKQNIENERADDLQRKFVRLKLTFHEGRLNEWRKKIVLIEASWTFTCFVLLFFCFFVQEFFFPDVYSSWGKSSKSLFFLPLNTFSKFIGVH